MSNWGIGLGVAILAAIGIGAAVILPRVFAEGQKEADDDNLPNPVTDIQFQTVPDEFTDGQSVGFFWNVIGGSGRFTGLLRPGDGSRIEISKGEFDKGQLFHVMKVGNLLTQNRRAILQIQDKETGVFYNASAEFIINPIDDIPGTTDYPIVISLKQPVIVTSNNELLAKVNYHNKSDRDTGPVTVLFQIKNPNNITKWIGSTPIGNIKPKATTTIEFRSGKLTTFSAGLEWVAQFFAWTSLDEAIILANDLKIGFTISRENNP